MKEEMKVCTKCGAISGDDWKQCKDWCPMGAPNLPAEPNIKNKSKIIKDGA